jgi:hypothetical protein
MSKTDIAIIISVVVAFAVFYFMFVKKQVTTITTEKSIPTIGSIIGETVDLITNKKPAVTSNTISVGNALVTKLQTGINYNPAVNGSQNY